jgi:thioredoxin 1
MQASCQDHIMTVRQQLNGAEDAGGSGASTTLFVGVSLACRAIPAVFIAASLGITAGCNPNSSNSSAVPQPSSLNTTETAPAQGTSPVVNVIHITGPQDFDERVLQADGVCLVDFFSSRCRPCTMLSPTIEELAAQYKGTVLVCKVSVDRPEMRSLERAYGVSCLPTVIVFNEGEEADRLLGLQREEAYSRVLDNLISQTASEQDKE